MAKIQIKNSFITSSGVIQISSSGVVFNSNITASGLKLTSLISSSSSGYVLGVDNTTGNIFKTPFGSSLQTGSTYPITASWAINVVNGGGSNLCGFTNNTSPYNTAIGCNALSSSTGTNNNAFGYNSLRQNTFGYNNNAFGYRTLYSNSTGFNNSAFGHQALRDNTTGYSNNAFGYQALMYNIDGYDNSAFGRNTLKQNISGIRNSAFGSKALLGNTGGSGNNAFGYNALNLNTFGGGNNAFGVNALSSNTSGNGNNAFGGNALKYNNANYNNAFGVNALKYNTTGTSNSAFGHRSLFRNTTGYQNSAFGSLTLVQNTIGYKNSAFGYVSLYFNTSGNHNSAFGHYTLSYNTTGNKNSAFGSGVMYNNQEGSNNSAFGYKALAENQIGNNNSAFGYKSLLNNQVDGNSAFGYQSLRENTSGTDNNAFGKNALLYNTEGLNNNAFGTNALRENIFGNNNNAFGTLALASNAFGNRNNAFGYKSLFQNIEGFSNSSFGHLALASNTFGYGNNAFGGSSLRYNDVGENNNAFGYFALRKNVSGNKNNAFGNYALRNNSTGNYNNAFGYNALRDNLVNSINAFGFGSLMNNTTGLYNSSFGHKALTSNIAGTSNSSFGYLALASNSYGYLTISSPVVYNVKFALLGDSGKTGYLGITQQVADGIKSYNPDFVIHLGDSNYTDETTVYSNFLNFWSDYDYSANMYLAFGNHDLDYDYGKALLRQLNVVRGLIGQENLDKNLLCYDFIRGPVHFFVLNSGNTASGETMDEGLDPNIQLQAQLDLLTPRIVASTIAWKVLVVHKPPFTNSANHRPGAIPLRLDYKALGIDVVLSAHGHNYEYFSINDTSYFVQGLGGAEIVCATEPTLPGTVTTYCGDYAYTIVDATLGETSRSISFLTYNLDGQLVDSVLIEKEGGTSGTATAGTGTSTSSVVGSGSGSGGAPGVNAGGEEVIVKMSGQSNNAFGTRALQLNKSGYYSNAFGSYALFNNLVGANNAFGYRSLAENTSGLYNSAFGHETLTKNTTGYNNSAFGYRALAENRTIYTQTFVPPSGGPAGALVFNQGADYLWYKNGSPVSFDIGTNDFTLEFYIKYETELGPGAVIFILGDPDNIGGGNNLALSKTNGDPNIDIAFPIAMGPTFSVDFASYINTWTHLAFSRNSGVLKFYINGVEQGSSTNSVNITGASLIFGDFTRGSGFGLSGQFSGIRLINGTGLYPSAFTPTEPAYITEPGCVVLVNSPTEVEKFDNTSGNTTTLEQSGVTWGGVVFGGNASTEGYIETTVVGTGYNNSAFGSKALSSNTIGNSNSAFGTYALNKNTTGYNNSAFGSKALSSNTIGYNNSAFGDKALYSNYSSSLTTIVNYSSLNTTVPAGLYNGYYSATAYYNFGDLFDIGTKDYTVEFWVSFSDLSFITGDKSIIFSFNNFSNILAIGFDVNDENLKLYIGDIYTSVATILDSTSVNDILVGKSAHMALSRVGTTLYVYINGSLVYTGTDSQNYNYNTRVNVSGFLNTSYEGITGKFASVRVLKGTALYTGESTICADEPPFTNIANTVLLLDYINDNKFGSYPFFYNKVDSYPGETYLSYAATPDPTTLSVNYCSSSLSYYQLGSSNNSAFGYLALASNTTGNYNSAFGSYALNKNNVAAILTEQFTSAQKTISSAGSYGFYYTTFYFSNYGNFNIGTNDYTFEFWVELYQIYNSDKAIIAAIKSYDLSIIVAIGFEPYDESLKLYVGNYYTPVATILDNATVYDLLLNKSAHIALSRSGTTLYVYINGSLVYTGTDNQNYSSNISISTSGIYNSGYSGFSGELSSVRVLNGTALYNGESTICVTEPPFTNIANTVLLLDYEGDNFLDNKADAPNVEPGGYSSVNPSFKSTLDVTYCVVSGSYSYSNGTKNSAFGANALYNINGGSNNVAVGYNAGSNIFAGDNNIIIGADVLAHDPSGSAQINIANFIFGIHPSGSYATGTNTTVGAKLGIGIDNPTNTLHVSASVNPLRLTGLTSSVNITYNLGVDNDGVVYLVNTGSGGNSFCGFTGTGATSNTVFGCDALSSNSSGNYNNAFGRYALASNTTGYQNNAFGNGALSRNTTGIRNSAFGHLALTYNTTGTLNNAFGYKSLTANTSGSGNSAFGTGALSSNTVGSGNHAFGFQALQANTTGLFNCAFGFSALASNQGGYRNSAFGTQALKYNRVNGNSAFGYQALARNTSGIANNAFGYKALKYNTTGINNNAFGYSALNFNTTGNSNNAFGKFALRFNTFGNYNSAFGYRALNYNTTGNSNNAFGYRTLMYNTTGVNNSAFGHQSLSANTGGANNNAFGINALTSNTTGYNNNAFGTFALASNTSGINNSAFGTQALFKNVEGSRNSAFGNKSLYANTTGNNNSAFGNYALQNNTIGYDNNAFGYSALFNNTTGINNNAFGYKALTNNTTGYQNSAFGDIALKYNTAGVANTAVGYRSLVYNTIGSGNSAVGWSSLRQNTTGSFNNAFGVYALKNNTTGTNNNAVGYNAGSNITTGNKNIIIGHNVYAPSATGNGQLNIANLIFATGSFGETTTVTTGAKVGIGINNPTYTLQVSGSFGATTKSFLIKHPDPNKKNMYLEHGVTESPEHTVFVRGKLENDNIIQLPDYWPYLVDDETITVTLTPKGKYQKLYVVDITNNQVIVGNDDNIPVNCYYYIVAERKDIPKLIPEK